MSIESTSERLWRIMSGIRRCSNAPRPVGRSSLTNTMFVSQLIEASGNESEFKKIVRDSSALQAWANSCSDEELAYLFWLERKHLPSAA